MKIKFHLQRKGEQTKIKDLMQIINQKANIELTDKQKEWIEQGIMDPIRLNRTKTSTRIAIQDFMHRTARSQIQHQRNCTLCGNQMNSIHLLTQCPVVREWERKIGCAKHAKKRRKLQFKRMSKGATPQRNAMWIQNWCIWITHNYVTRKENNVDLDKAHLILKKNIENEEFRYLLLHQNVDTKQIKGLVKHLIFKKISSEKIVNKIN